MAVPTFCTAALAMNFDLDINTKIIRQIRSSIEPSQTPSQMLLHQRIDRIVVLTMVPNFLSILEHENPIDIQALRFNRVLHILVPSLVECCARVVGCDAVALSVSDMLLRIQCIGEVGPARARTSRFSRELEGRGRTSRTSCRSPRSLRRNRRSKSRTLRTWRRLRAPGSCAAKAAVSPY